MTTDELRVERLLGLRPVCVGDRVEIRISGECACTTSAANAVWPKRLLHGVTGVVQTVGYVGDGSQTPGHEIAVALDRWIPVANHGIFTDFIRAVLCTRSEVSVLEQPS